MSTRPTGSPIWIDLGSHDLEAAIPFHTELFGWTFTDQGEDFGHYHMITRDGSPVGGAMSTLMGPDGPTDQPQSPTAWTVYLATEDVQATTDNAQRNGATIIVPPMPVRELGSMAVLEDPAGAVVGLWQPDQFEGFVSVPEPGAPVWFEAMVRDFDAALPFYRDVLDWNPQYMGGDEQAEVRYVTNDVQDAASAGLYDASSWNPTSSYWRAYIGMEDTDASLAKLQQLGGTLVDGPEDTPFGRLATVQDPQGAQFQIIQGQR